MGKAASESTISAWTARSKVPPARYYRNVTCASVHRPLLRPPVFALLTALLGGVGLFLVGMILMTDGLKAAAGPALQRVLARSTGTPARAFAAGVGLTALVQSSSATVLATIGFVSAGLLPFANALGVIVGASVGTTSTGWIVALLGLKLSVGAFAFPLVGVGALLRLLARGRAAHLGMALAGFGLIFVGIEALREGMGGLAAGFDLGALPGETLGGRLVLAAVGVAMTVALQSSSAAIALTLTAVHEGAVSVAQAAALAIGQSVGTTVTAVLAAAGASAPARRTAAAQVAFNGTAGLLAFLAMGPLVAASAALARAAGATDPATTVTVFHTLFHVLAALLVLPVLRPFGRAVARLVPEPVPALTRRLDRSQHEVPAAALAAAEATLRETAAQALAEAEALLAEPPRAPDPARLAAAEEALRRTHAFLGEVRMNRDDRAAYAHRLALLHAGDHLARLLAALAEGPLGGADGTTVASARRTAAATLAEARAWLASRSEDGTDEGPVARLEEASVALAETRRAHRAALLAETAAGRLHPDRALARLDAVRRIDRLLYHAWRMAHHLARRGVDPFAPEAEQEGGPE